MIWRIIYFFGWIFFILAIIEGNVWATKHGSPQHVWFFCDMLEWCKR